MNAARLPSIFPALCVLLLLLLRTTSSAAATNGPLPGNTWINKYFAVETARLEAACLKDIHTASDWEQRRGAYRRELQEMLGLHPWPERTPLHAVTTGGALATNFTVENIQFQSIPGLYVTGNLYLPKGQERPCPAVLYVCGHGPMIRDGISYGNKVTYQHHGAWLAENGYVCLVIDTLQLGEIQGIHHGTYRYGMWWWNARGYTPAGVEAWNGVRALDYLVTRPEVDASRIGITGRSGGGAYSWTIAALDDRVRVAAPVAGITDLRNHVVDGAVEGHCDCMFFVNTFGWDYPMLAALVSPRPLLIANSDRDSIFPLDGVVRLHDRVRHLYQLQSASTNLGLLITEGPHKDTQDLQLPVLRWFNRFLKKEDPLIDAAARARFEPSDLRVLTTLPLNARNTNIQASFVSLPPPVGVPGSDIEWQALNARWISELSRCVFRNAPGAADSPTVREQTRTIQHGLRFRILEYETHPGLPLRLYVLEPKRRRSPAVIQLEVLDESGWDTWARAMAKGFPQEFPADQAAEHPQTSRAANQSTAAAAFERLRSRIESNNCVLAWVAPRGIGPTAWTGDDKYLTHLRRRFMLLGQTLDSMRVWDIRKSLQVIRSRDRNCSIIIRADGVMAANALYAAILEPPVAALTLSRLPRTHAEAPDYLNVLRVLDLPQAVAMAAARSKVRLVGADPKDWEFARAAITRLKWPESQLRFD